jgi:hypothetical protein
LEDVPIAGAVGQPVALDQCNRAQDTLAQNISAHWPLLKLIALQLTKVLWA